METKERQNDGETCQTFLAIAEEVPGGFSSLPTSHAATAFSSVLDPVRTVYEEPETTNRVYGLTKMLSNPNDVLDKEC